MSGQCITLQIGSLSNHIASNFWNLENEAKKQEFPDYDASVLFAGSKRSIPRCVAVDYSSSFVKRYYYQGNEQSTKNALSILWSGPTQVIERNQRNGADMEINSAERWIENLQIAYHERTSVALPQSIHSSNFDNFFCGYENAPNLSTTKMNEEILERVRFFAEECDYLSSVLIITDMDDGFGGLTSSLLDDLQEELSRSVTLPIFGLSNTNSHSRGEHTNSIHLPLMYGTLFGHCDMFCPISLESTIDKSLKLSTIDSLIWASSNTAAVLNVLRSPLNFSSSISSFQALSHHQWLDDVTWRRQYPLLSVEALYPEPIDLSDSNYRLWPYLEGEKSNSTTDREHDNMVSLSSKVMNPFLKPLSIFRRELFNDRAHLIQLPYSHRSPVNSIFVRGPCRADLSSKLFLKCLNTDYAVTSFHQRNAPLCIPERYPYITESGSVDYLEEYINAEDFLTPTIAALGVDASIEYNLHEHVVQWTKVMSHPSAISAQLDAFGYSKDDRADLAEKLNQLHQIYMAN